MVTERATCAEAIEDSAVANRTIVNRDVARTKMARRRRFEDVVTALVSTSVSVEILQDWQMSEIGIYVSPREAPGLKRGNKQSRTATDHTRL